MNANAVFFFFFFLVRCSALAYVSLAHTCAVSLMHADACCERIFHSCKHHHLTPYWLSAQSSQQEAIPVLHIRKHVAVFMFYVRCPIFSIGQNWLQSSCAGLWKTALHTFDNTFGIDILMPTHLTGCEHQLL